MTKFRYIGDAPRTYDLVHGEPNPDGTLSTVSVEPGDVIDIDPAQFPVMHVAEETGVRDVPIIPDGLTPDDPAEAATWHTGMPQGGVLPPAPPTAEPDPVEATFVDPGGPISFTPVPDLVPADPPTVPDITGADITGA